MKESPFVSSVLKLLKERYGEGLHTELKHADMTELFVAVLLSPQCTDKQVNTVTEGLFRKFRNFEEYANADIRTLRKEIGGINYYKTKARNLKRSARIIIERFGGEVPDSIGRLMELPGVGRKVANVIQNEGFGKSEGIAVDTHCITVSRMLGLSRHRLADNIERDLQRKIPEGEWRNVSNLFIALGRDTCRARRKECARCILKEICPSSEAMQ